MPAEHCGRAGRKLHLGRAAGDSQRCCAGAARARPPRAPDYASGVRRRSGASSGAGRRCARNGAGPGRTTGGRARGWRTGCRELGAGHGAVSRGARCGALPPNLRRRTRQGAEASGRSGSGGADRPQCSFPRAPAPATAQRGSDASGCR